VRVDGVRAVAGQPVDPARNVVTISGKSIRPFGTWSTQVIVLNKPAGVVTTMRDEHGRRNVAHLLPDKPRLFPIGRLDADTTGLLLCTNDGGLATFLAHPSSEIERTYAVRVDGSLSAEQAAGLKARNVKHHGKGQTSFEVSLFEGKNRQVRRMCAQLGLRVVGLTRTRFGPVALGKLAPGATRILTRVERDALEHLRGRA